MGVKDYIPVTTGGGGSQKRSIQLTMSIELGA